jgi:hypothetical protein
MDLKGIGWGGLDSFASGYGPVADFCDNGNEPFGSMKGRQLIDYLSEY